MIYYKCIRIVNLHYIKENQDLNLTALTILTRLIFYNHLHLKSLENISFKERVQWMSMLKRI